MLNVTLYTRKDCSLCDQARQDLAALQAQVPHKVTEIDIESDPVLHQKLLVEIPVVEVGPYRKIAPFSRTDLMITLSAARDRSEQLDRVGDSRHQRRQQQGQVISRSDRISLWMAKNYLLVILLIIGLYVGLPTLAPVLMKAGATGPAQLIYLAYSPLCHQLAFRSFFLFGEQPYYPRVAAEVAGAKTYGEFTGADEKDLIAARKFLGNEQMGYKMAFCQRDVAIYGAIMLFTVLYGLTGRRIKPLHWLVWLGLGWGPIGLDGFSQLFSQLGWDFLAALIPFRESTPMLRVITGGLFGFTTAWFGVPYIEESMRETRQLLIKKFSVLAGK